jgi:hypothetical protein
VWVCRSGLGGSLTWARVTLQKCQAPRVVLSRLGR